MKCRRQLCVLCLASSVGVAAMSAPAGAQRIDRIVVFGDSYADTGNALRLAGTNPITTGVYTTGRFSGGSNYIDTLSDILQVPQVNFAIGGARTNNANQNAGLPGLTFEVQQFLAGGGALGFPAVNTTLDRSDLVAVSIGGNDARNYQQTGGTLAGAPAAAATAVSSFQQNFNAVMQRGTPTISFLAGDTGRLPEIATNPAGAAVRTAYSTAFNSGVQSVLAGYAANGAIVHYLDLTAILNEVSANPGAYGISGGLVCPAFPDPTCISNSNAPYLFYGDLLHLTSRGFAIVGQYVPRQLAAPLTLQAPSDLGFETARQWGRTLSSRSDLYGRGGAEGLRLYALADGFTRDVRATASNSPLEIRGYGGTAGAEFGIARGMVGIAANYSRPKVRFGNDSSGDRARSWQVGGYGSIGMGGMFGQAHVGYGRDRNRITREGVVADMTARASGSHTVAGAKAGYLMTLTALQVGPVAALDYARARVNGYTETGDPALNLNVSRQSLKVLTGQAGIQLRGDLAGLRPYIDLVAEHDFTGDSRVIAFSQTSASGIVNRWDVPGRKQTYGRLSGGASVSLGMLSVDVSASSTVGRKHGNDTSGRVGVKAGF